MLKLSAAHLKEQRRNDPTKRLVWLDIGGGTGESCRSIREKARTDVLRVGWNIEEMDKVSAT